MCFTLFFINSYLPAPMIETIIQWRVQEFVGGGGQKFESLFLCFSIYQGGASSENSRENDISD